MEDKLMRLYMFVSSGFLLWCFGTLFSYSFSLSTWIKWYALGAGIYGMILCSLTMLFAVNE